MTLFKSSMIENGVLVSNSHNICYSHNQMDLKIILNAYKRTFSLISDSLKKRNLKKKIITSRTITPILQVREQKQKSY